MKGIHVEFAISLNVITPEIEMESRDFGQIHMCPVSLKPFSIYKKSRMLKELKRSRELSSRE